MLMGKGKEAAEALKAGSRGINRPYGNLSAQLADAEKQLQDLVICFPIPCIGAKGKTRDNEVVKRVV